MHYKKLDPKFFKMGLQIIKKNWIAERTCFVIITLNTLRKYIWLTSAIHCVEWNISVEPSERYRRRFPIRSSSLRTLCFSLSSVYICSCVTSVLRFRLWLVGSVGREAAGQQGIEVGEGEITERNSQRYNEKKWRGLGELQWRENCWASRKRQYWITCLQEGPTNREVSWLPFVTSISKKG